VARLLVVGELRQVLPLDDAKQLDAAKPQLHNGQVVPDPAAKAKRQDAMAQALLKAGPVAVAILAGSHDLTTRCVAKTWQGSNAARVCAGAQGAGGVKMAGAMLANPPRCVGPQCARDVVLRA
jgi:hypothetical protein